MESTPAAPVPADVKPAEAARLTMASSAAAASAPSATGVNVGAHANPGSPQDDGRESLRLAQGVVLTAQGISVQHLDRLLGGELLAATPRLPWSQLLRRTYGFDVLRCGCGGRLRLVTAITDKAVARAILTHLGLPADARWARGRDPTLVYDDLESPWDGPADRAGGAKEDLSADTLTADEVPDYVVPTESGVWRFVCDVGTALSAILLASDRCPTCHHRRTSGCSC